MTVETPEKAATQKIARGMQVIADVAKLYKKHGSPANYKQVKTTSTMNHAWKRTIRLMAQRHSPFKRGPLARCGTCQLYFVGPAAARCQCPPAKPQRSEA